MEKLFAGGDENPTIGRHWVGVEVGQCGGDGGEILGNEDGPPRNGNRGSDIDGTLNDD